MLPIFKEPLTGEGWINSWPVLELRERGAWCVMCNPSKNFQAILKHTAWRILTTSMYILDLRHIIFASEDIPALDTLLQMHGCQIGITKQQVANIGNHSPSLVVLFVQRLVYCQSSVWKLSISINIKILDGSLHIKTCNHIFGNGFVIWKIKACCISEFSSVN